MPGFLFNRKISLILVVIAFNVSVISLSADKGREKFTVKDLIGDEDIIEGFEDIQRNKIRNFFLAISAGRTYDMQEMYEDDNFLLDSTMDIEGLLFSPLLYAIELGRSKSVQKLYELGLPPKTEIDGKSPIPFAFKIKDRTERKAVLKVLLDNIEDDKKYQFIKEWLVKTLQNKSYRLAEDIVEVIATEENVKDPFFAGEDEYTFFSIARAGNNLELMRKLVSLGADFKDFKDFLLFLPKEKKWVSGTKERSMLLNAICVEDLEKIESIVKSFPLFTWKYDGRKFNPFTYAIEQGKLNSITALIKSGFSPDSKLEDDTPLLSYAYEIKDRVRRQQVIKLLLDKSNNQDKALSSIVDVVQGMRDNNFVEDIILAVVDQQNINKIFHLNDGSKVTFLSLAIESKNCDLVSQLIQIADINQKIDGKSYLHIFQKNDYYNSHIDNENHTTDECLYKERKESISLYKNMVFLLEEKGLQQDLSIEFQGLLEAFGEFDCYVCKCSVDEKCNCDKNTRGLTEESSDRIYALLEKNENLLRFQNTEKESLISSGQLIEKVTVDTLLKEAVTLKNRDLVIMLLEKGADIKEIIGKVFTLLDYCLLNKADIEFMSFLLDKGAPVSRSFLNKLGDELDPIFVNRSEDIYQKQEINYEENLIDYKIIDDLDDENYLLYQLFDAIEKSNVERVKEILKQLFNINKELLNNIQQSQVKAVTEDGYEIIFKRETPLLCAIRKKNFEIIEILVDFGVDVDILIGGKNSSPLYQAIAAKNTNLINLLLKDGAKVSQILLDIAEMSELPISVIRELENRVPGSKKSARRTLCFNTPPSSPSGSPHFQSPTSPSFSLPPAKRIKRD